MTVRPRLRHAKRALLVLAAATALAVGALFAGAGAATPARAATQLPCDIYAAAGTGCVAAHSTTRALYAAYNGPLYQVKRTSDGTTTNISTLSAGGYANAAAQDSFCSGTYCTITEIYDQSGHGNNLTIGPAGGNGAADIGANAAALPVMAGGHKVYGVYISPAWVTGTTTPAASRPALSRRVPTWWPAARTSTVGITSVTSSSSSTLKANATWIVEPGLANSSCISFKTDNGSGDYIRHFDFQLFLEPNDGTSQFALDATFCPRAGNSGSNYSFMSYNYSYKYIRHFNFVGYIASDGGSNAWDASSLWQADTTWLVASPWA